MMPTYWRTALAWVATLYPATRTLTGGRSQRGRENRDGGGLAGAVWTEQNKKLAGRDVE